jgi:predicted aspartyl protease
MRVARCWNFSEDEQPPYPTIEVTMSSASGKVTASPKVDTGFNGSLAIGREVVRTLRLTPVGTVLIKTASGHDEVPVYVVDLSQPDLGLAYTTLAIGTERSLVGRKLIENRAWLLDCKDGKFCVMTPMEPERGHPAAVQ